ASRVVKARPRVKIARSFALDSTLYAVARTLGGQGLVISSLEKGKRIFIPLKGEGHKKSQESKRRAKITITNQINRAINEMIKRREPKVIVTEKLDFRGKGPSKEVSRRVSYWSRSTLKDRFEFKASAARLPSRAGQSSIHLANLSGMRILGKGEPQRGRVSMSEVRTSRSCGSDRGSKPEEQIF